MAFVSAAALLFCLCFDLARAGVGDTRTLGRGDLDNRSKDFYIKPHRELLTAAPQTTPAPAEAALSSAFDASENSGYYDVDAGPWNTSWSQDAIRTQKADGETLLKNISAAVSALEKLYTILPGTYRISQPIAIGSTTNFTLVANDVELIAEGPCLHFALANNTNLAITGTLILDADPIGFSQGVIIDTDNATHIVIRLMDGYQPPQQGKRIVFFDPEGTMQSLYQVSADSVEQSTNEADVFTLFMPAFFWASFATARANAMAIGNLVSIEGGVVAGGIHMAGNNGVRLANLSMHSYALTFGQGEKGLVDIESLKGIRRPQTNRLSAGGFVAVSLAGGSLHLMNSELSYNFDDLTDVQSGLSYAFKQLSPTELYVGFHAQPAIGDALNFYDLETLKFEGVSHVASVQSVSDQTITGAFRNGLTALSLLNWNVTPQLVTLTGPINMSSQYSLVDNLQGQASSIIIEDCFMHDSLASGINAKGAKEIIIRNNKVCRAGYRGASVGFDPYWWEGGVPSNILIEGNIIDATPYTTGDISAAISTYVDTSTPLLASATAAPIHNVTVQHNIIRDPPVAGIAISFSTDNFVFNNTVIKPVASIGNMLSATAQPFAHASAVFLDMVAGSTTIYGNIILDVDNQLTPQSIKVSPSTPLQGITICNNMEQSGTGGRQPLPDEAWTFEPADSSAVSYSNLFARGQFASVGSRLNISFSIMYSSVPNATATFGFNGTAARWYTCRGPMYGAADVFVDGVLTTTIDNSLLSLSGVHPDVVVGFCDQMVFDTGGLGKGLHNLTISVTGRPGKQSRDQAAIVAISGFDALKGISTCRSANSPAVATPSPSPLQATPRLPGVSSFLQEENNLQPAEAVDRLASRSP